jgi:hypothetical protein
MPTQETILKSKTNSTYIQTITTKDGKAGESVSWTRDGTELSCAAYLSRDSLLELEPKFKEHSEKPGTLLAMIKNANELPLHQTGGYMVYLEDSKSGPAKRSSIITTTDKTRPSAEADTGSYPVKS